MSKYHALARLTPLTALMLLAVPQVDAAQPELSSLKVTISGIKSAKGVVRLAICPPQTGFPDCKDKAVRIASLPIDRGIAQVDFSGLPAGTYAVSVFHDANANGKLDTFLGVPSEGYGFSRNPPFRPRAPKWSEAGVAVTGEASLDIKIRYIL